MGAIPDCVVDGEGYDRDLAPPPATIDAVRGYYGRGFAVARLTPGKKRPTDAGWTQRSREPHEFRPGDGVGIMTGPLSGSPGHALVCVDLDAADAVERADAFLPPTGMVDGRPGKPRSHRWYLVPLASIPDACRADGSEAATAAKERCGHSGPKKASFKTPDRRTIVELLGTGQQAAVPPSVHASGERREWDGGEPGRPAVVAFGGLLAAVEELAVACGYAPERREPEPEVTDDGTPSGTRGATPDPTPSSDGLRRAGWYLDAIPDADLPRSGRRGHDTFLRHACSVVNGFLVRDPAAFRDLIERHYNGRLRRLGAAEPDAGKAAGWEPWSAADIDHKFDEALKKADSDPRFRPGWMFREGDDPRGWNDPVRAAELFADGHHVLRVRGRWVRHDGKRWVFVDDEFVPGAMRTLLEGEARREARRRVAEWERQADELRREATALRSQADAPQPAAWRSKAEEAEFRREQSKAERELAKVERGMRNAARPGAPAVTRELVANCVDSLKSRRMHDPGADTATPVALDVWTATPDGVGGVDGGGASWLAVDNGILELGSLHLRPHTPDWFSTVCIPVAFDAAAGPPARWLGLLDELFENDAERVAVVQELFGACLDRRFPAKHFFAFVGGGENGKSTVQTVLRAVLGDRNVSAVPLDHLSTNRFAAFGMLGKLANVGGDQSYFESSDEGTLKTLTGGDAIPFEQKGRDVIYAVNTAKLVFACNTPPKFSDKSEAVWNRLVMVPFDYTVPADRKDPRMNTPEFWRGELSGVLNWALAGLARLKGNRGVFTRSEACEAMKCRHRLDSNPARQFLADTVEAADPASLVSAPDLFSEYRHWCDANGFTHRLTSNAFTKEVKHLFPAAEKQVKKKDGKSVRHWSGLQWIEGKQPQQSPSGYPQPREDLVM